MKKVFDFNCPHCGSENIRKLSLIYRDGISDIEVRGFRSSQQTASSQIAAPPFSPDRFLRICCFVIVPLLFIGHMGHSAPIFILALVLGIISIIICRIYATTTYRDALKEWNDTYECQRCEETFLLE